MNERIIFDAGENEYWRYVILEKGVDGVFRERFAATILQDANKLIEDTTWGDTLNKGGLPTKEKKVKYGKQKSPVGNSRTVNRK